jgi:hypothetical protein
MAVEFKVTLQDTPGTLARLGRILGDAGVNIEAIQGASREGRGFIHFVPNDPGKAAVALDAAGSLTASARCSWSGSWTSRVCLATWRW